MTLNNSTSLVVREDWFTLLIDELKDLIVESEFTARDVVIQCYHQVGTRILQENSNFEREKIYGEKIVQRIAESLGKSERMINYAIKFAQLYPDLSLLPEGKNISFHHIINKYLTTGEKKPTITKGELMKQIKEIKKLLETEYLKSHQEEVNARITDYIYYAKKKCDFIRYLQDQVNKITGGKE